MKIQLDNIRFDDRPVRVPFFMNGLEAITIEANSTTEFDAAIFWLDENNDILYIDELGEQTELSEKIEASTRKGVLGLEPSDSSA